MIPTVIHRERDAPRTTNADIRRLVSYVSAKAVAVETCNVLADWRDADWQMWATANGNKYCRTLTHHFILSWPETEHPTSVQTIVGARHAIAALGAKECQAVIAVHTDRANTHVHVALSKIHPVTFKAISMSHDYAKLEKACRDIEMHQGWSQDQGRFDAVMIETPDGPKMEMRPKPPEHWEAKQARRASGRGVTQGDLNHQRQTGLRPLIDALSHTWKARIRSALDGAISWPSMHSALSNLGLAYTKSGSGGRLSIRGSDQYLSPSQLGKRYAWKAMFSRFGEWKAAEQTVGDTTSNCWSNLLNEVTGTPELDLQPGPRSKLSKQNLIAKTYVAITADDQPAKLIARLGLDNAQPTVILRNGHRVRDVSDVIKTTVSKDYAAQICVMIAMVKAKGWVNLAVKGTNNFVKSIRAAAMGAGLSVQDDLHITEVGKSTARPAATAPTPQLKARMHAAPAVADATRRDTLHGQRGDRLERSRLRAAQQLQRDELRTRIGSSRGLREQVLRAGLKMFHSDERKQLRLRQKERRRLRQKERKHQQIMSEGSMISAPIADRSMHLTQRILGNTVSGKPLVGWSPNDTVSHAPCRRWWNAMAEQRRIKPSRGPLQIEVMDFDRLPRDCRIMKFGKASTTLIAHRDVTDNIVGFERMLSIEDEVLEYGIADGGRSAAYVINDPAIATRAIVVKCAAAALALHSTENRHDTLYISIGGRFSSDTQMKLAIVLKDKLVMGLFDDTTEGQALFADLKKVAPSAVDLMERTPQNAQDDGSPKASITDELDETGRTFSI